MSDEAKRFLFLLAVGIVFFVIGLTIRSCLGEELYAERISRAYLSRL